MIRETLVPIIIGAVALLTKTTAYSNKEIVNGKLFGHIRVMPPSSCKSHPQGRKRPCFCKIIISFVSREFPCESRASPCFPNNPQFPRTCRCYAFVYLLVQVTLQTKHQPTPEMVRCYHHQRRRRFPPQSIIIILSNYTDFVLAWSGALFTSQCPRPRRFCAFHSSQH